MKGSMKYRVAAITVIIALAGIGEVFGAPQPELQDSQQDWPSQPITIVVGDNPGGSSDSSARALANAARKYLNDVPINVENRPGGSGIAGGQYVLTQPADGYTLFHNWGNVHWTFGRHVREIPFDPFAEFRAVSGVVSLSIALVVPIDSPFRSVDELVSYAEQNPNKLTYTTAGRGGAHWLVAVDFLRRAGIQVREIANQQGGAEARNMVGGGHVDMAFMATFLGAALEGDRTRILAVAFPERDPLVPGVPTFHEAGYEIVMAAPTQLLATHAGVPDWKVERLSNAFLDAMSDESFLNAVRTLGLVPIPWDYRTAQNHVDKMDIEFGQLAIDLGLAR